jgi:hypothetical protein
MLTLIPSALAAGITPVYVPARSDEFPAPVVPQEMKPNSKKDATITKKLFFI